MLNGRKSFLFLEKNKNGGFKGDLQVFKSNEIELLQLQEIKGELWRY